jgi:small subunit ribosomal protein S6|tara:strand:+ start:662 stop:970 length:309 start_codon:yes stop_codon:yes gene_type:complete
MHKELELYEILFLLDPNFTEKEIADKITFYQDFLTSQGSKVMVQNQGRKALSYPIKKFEVANFVQMVFLGNGNLINTFTNLLKRDELVLRQLITKLNEPLKT